MKSDGSIRIETRIDNAKAKKDLESLNNIVNDSADNISDDMSASIEKINADWKKLEIQQDKNNKKMYEYKEQLESVKVPKLSETTNSEINRMVIEADKTTERLSKLETMMSVAKSDGENVIKYESEYELLTKKYEMISDKIEIAKTKQLELNKIAHQTNIENLKQGLTETEAISTSINAKFSQLGNKANIFKEKIEESNQKAKGLDLNFKDTGKSITSGISKLAKYGLALLSFRTIYQTLSSLANTWLNSGSDAANQTKANIEAIKNSLAQVIAPVIQKIVDAVIYLMQIVNYLSEAWFGFKVFSDATNKNMKSTAKSAKEIRKQLAGFDEMNILSDNSSSANETSVSPSFSFDNFEAPEWLEWIAKNKDLVLGFFIELGIIIAGLKIYDWLSTITKGFTNFDKVVKGLGIGLIIIGIGIAIKGVIDFIKEPSWNNFLTILQGIALIVAGIAVLMSGWVVAVVALGVAVVAYVIQNWEKVKEILGVVASWIYDKVIKPVGDFFKTMWDGLKEGGITAWNSIKDTFSSVSTWFKDVFSKAWSGVKNVFSTGGKIFDGIKEGIANVFKNVVNGITSGINRVIAVPFNTINGLLNKIRSVSVWGFKPFETFISYNPLPVPSIPKLKTGTVLTRPRQVIAGENGPEAIVPLDRNAEWLSALTDAIVDKLDGLNSSGSGDVYLDSEKVGRVLRNANKKWSLATNGGRL